MTKRRVVRAGSREQVKLESDNWTVIARSWGAALVAQETDVDRLASIVDRVRHIVDIRELTAADTDAVMALDRSTANDYPGDVATAHDSLTHGQATPNPKHRGWGAFDGNAHLVALTFTFPAEVTETDFTVVDVEWRGAGLGAAVKAASVLALANEGHRQFRTGGSADNPGIIAANKTVGYVVDEEWVTLSPMRADTL